MKTIALSGNWVITDGKGFLNPKTDKMETPFSTKHLFYNWQTLSREFQFNNGKSLDGKPLFVKSVKLNPVFTSIESPKTFN